MKCAKELLIIKRALPLLVLCSGLLLTGCESARNGNTTGTETRLELTGNVVGSHVVVDDLLTFDVTSTARTQFRLRPGKHHVRIERQGRVLVDQTVALKRGQTLEVAVP